MENNGYKHFTVIVAGDDPETLMKDYDNNLKIEPYVLYHYNDAQELKNKYIDIYRKILNKSNYDFIKPLIDEIEEQSASEFFENLTIDLDHDENTGDAITNKNPLGKWSYYSIGKHLSIPFKLKDSNEEVFQSLKKDIDWKVMHLYNNHIYEAAWDMVMNGKKPTNDEEKLIYENMKERTLYFQSYDNKENYVLVNSSFWAYAFLSNETGWVEMDDETSQFEWVKNYYNNFIKNLPNETKLTIYECVR